MAALVAAGVWPAPASAAGSRRSERMIEGFSANGALRLSLQGYETRLGPNRSTSTLLSELAEGSGRGYIWRPRFAQVRLGLEAGTLQRFSPDHYAPGRLASFEAELALLPVSVFPLRLEFASRQRVLSTTTLPGQDYRSRTLGLSWKFLAPRLFPRLWLNLAEHSFVMHSDSVFLPDQTGLRRGQDFAGRMRLGSFELMHNDAASRIFAQYRIRERKEDRVNSLTGAVESRTMVIEAVNLQGAANPSSRLRLALDGNLRNTRMEGFENRRYSARAHLRYEPEERFFTSASYAFQGESLFGSASHNASAFGGYQYSDAWSFRSMLNVDQSRFAEGAPLRSRTQEVLSLGTSWNESFGAHRTSLSETFRAGVAQADPGEAGIIVSNGLHANHWMPLARGHDLALNAGIENATDRSSFGSTTAAYNLAGNWTGLLPARIQAYGTTRFSHSRRSGGPQGFLPDRQSRFDTWVGGRRDFQYALKLNGRLGWSTIHSSRAAQTTNTAVASAGLSWLPYRTLTLGGQLGWRVVLVGAGTRTSFDTTLSLRWRIRSLVLSAAYRLSLTNQLGLPGRTQVLLIDLRRSFGASF
ncbi:MAG: hypothetical protein P1V51_01890 [Deltaproteobacteria bacterium]|nr:hypothetical protein [Deltaproteobacteria bacterium]